MASMGEILNIKDMGAEKIKALKDFFSSDKDINMKTSVKRNEIPDYAKLEFMDTYFKKYGINLGLTDMLKVIKELRVSEDRKGRTEAFMVLGNSIEEKQSTLDKFLGRGS